MVGRYCNQLVEESDPPLLWLSPGWLSPGWLSPGWESSEKSAILPSLVEHWEGLTGWDSSWYSSSCLPSFSPSTKPSSSSPSLPDDWSSLVLSSSSSIFRWLLLWPALHFIFFTLFVRPSLKKRMSLLWLSPSAPKWDSSESERTPSLSAKVQL